MGRDWLMRMLTCTALVVPDKRIPFMAVSIRLFARIRSVVSAGMLAATAAVSCADFDSVVDPAFGLPDVVVAVPSFEDDIQPIFDLRCALGGCHSLAAAQAGLTLDASASYESLVGVPSTLRPQFLRVAPGDAPNSWLVRRIGDDPVARLGHQRMPLSSLPLTPNQIATIVNWIEQGALRN